MKLILSLREVRTNVVVYQAQEPFGGMIFFPRNMLKGGNALRLEFVLEDKDAPTLKELMAKHIEEE